MDAVVEALKEPLPYHKFRVKLRSLDGVEVYGLLAMPIRGEGQPKPMPPPKKTLPRHLSLILRQSRYPVYSR